VKSGGRINKMDNVQKLTYNHSNLERKTIMICDDERDVLELFGLVLESKYDVILVESGEECMRRVY
jgi:response regulator RpfG family c-di-GMP phosphodiesterase